jgi:hypothetical protein
VCLAIVPAGVEAVVAILHAVVVIEPGNVVEVAADLAAPELALSATTATDAAARAEAEGIGFGRQLPAVFAGMPVVGMRGIPDAIAVRDQGIALLAGDLSASTSCRAMLHARFAGGQDIFIKASTVPGNDIAAYLVHNIILGAFLTERSFNVVFIIFRIVYNNRAANEAVIHKFLIHAISL